MTEDAAAMPFIVTFFSADQMPFPAGVGLELLNAGEVVATAETESDGTARFPVEPSTLTSPAVRLSAG
jgi:hypothetical protein